MRQLVRADYHNAALHRNQSQVDPLAITQQPVVSCLPQLGLAIEASTDIEMTRLTREPPYHWRGPGDMIVCLTSMSFPTNY